MKINLGRTILTVLILYLQPLISIAGFVPNKGQIADKNGKVRPDVLFTFDTPNARLFFKKDRIVYALFNMDHLENESSREYLQKGNIEAAKFASLRIFEQRIDMVFKDALPNPEIIFEDPNSDRINFYLAHCPQGITGVQAYNQVTYKNLYNGIDLVFKLDKGTLKYDLILHPGAKLSDIQFKYDGVSSITKKGKDFEINTDVRSLHESIPASFWEDDRTPVNVEYYLMDDNTFGFAADGIETVSRTLVIDPTLAWATYLERSGSGASSSIRGNVTTDANGNFYYQINTYSPNLPVVNPGVGAWYDPSYNPSSGLDIYFAKFDINRQMVWATYLGGTGTQTNYYDHGLAITGSTLYVGGVTSSTDFPLMNQGGGAYYQTSPGTGDKGFLSKFNTSTGVMQHSTYLLCYSQLSLAVDGNGNVAVSSFNYSWSTAPTVMARAGAYNDPTFNGSSDVFLYMFNSNMVQTWGTWLGGTGYEEPMGITFDSNNELILFNRSDNATVPLVNPGGGAFFDNTYSDKYDYWLMRFNTSGALVWSTLLGGNGLEGLSYSQVTTNSNNEVIFTSTTRSTVMNLVNPGGGAYYQTMPAGLTDGYGGTGYCAGFLMRFNSNNVLVHSTYMGANNEEVYIQGQTPGVCNKHYILLQSKTFPTVPLAGSYNVTNSNPSTYGYLAMEMNPTFGIGWSSYVHNDSTYMERIVTDRVNGRLYVTGMTQARDFPVTNPGGGAYYDGVINSGTGSSYVFGIMQFDIGAPPVLGVSGGGPATVCAGQSITLTASGAGTINWYNAASGGTLLGTGSTLTYTPGVTTVYAEAVSGGCASPRVPITITVNPAPSTPIFTTNSPLCVGSTLNLNGPTVAGATYIWTGPNGFSSSLEDPSISNVTTAAGGTYSLQVVVSGCTSVVASQTVVVNASLSAPSFTWNSPLCAGSNLNLNGQTIAGASYVWSGPNGFTSTIEDPTISSVSVAASGTYNLYVVVGGCTSATTSQTITVNPIPTTPTISSNSPVCSGGTLQLSANTISNGVYYWTGPNGFTSNIEDPTITNISSAGAGTYSLYIEQNSCTSSTVSTIVVVNATPSTPSISSNSPICEGTNIQLSAPTIPGATYVWTGPNGFTSNAEDPTITNAQTVNSGNYSLIIVQNGCSSSAATTNTLVTSAPSTPTITSNSPLCSGSSILLNTGTVAGATYVWSGPNGFVSNLEDPVITNATSANSGTYFLTLVVGSCSSSTASHAVTVNTIPAISQGTVVNPTACGLNNGSIQVTGSGTGNLYWVGTNTGNANSVSLPQTISNLGAGVYDVYFVPVAGCTSNVLNVSLVDPTPPPTPIISANSPLCEGGTINLNSTTISNAAYYWTGPNGFTSNLEDPVISNAGIAASGTYSVYVVVAGCTSSTATISVSVNAIPSQPSITTSTPICEGSALTISTPAVAGATYVWSGPSGFNPSTASNTINNANSSNSGVYTLQVVVSGCTSAVATQNIVVNPIPVLSINASATNVCEGSAVTLTGSGASNLSWDNGIFNGVPFQIFSTTTYTLTGTDANGCSSTESITINVAGGATVNVQITTNDADNTICEGSSIALTGSGAGSYVWLHDNSNSTTVFVSPTQTTVYTVVGFVGICNDTASVTIDVADSPDYTLVASDTIICPGTSINLTAQGTGANVLWNTGETSNTITVSPGLITTYSFTATNAQGCSTSASIQVYPGQNPEFSLNDSIKLCFVGADIHAGNGYATYLWNTGAQTESISVNTTGYYSVIVSNAQGCTATDSTFVSFSIFNADAGAVGDHNVVLCAYGTVLLEAQGGTSYEWSGPNNYYSDDAQNELVGITAINAGEYIVSIFNEDNCAITDTVVVSIAPDKDCVEVTELVTPNNDGKNDALTFSFLNMYPNHKLSIYNRWGSLVYETKNYQNNWSGMANTGALVGKGELLPAATYFYLFDPGNGEKPIRGFVELQY